MTVLRPRRAFVALVAAVLALFAAPGCSEATEGDSPYDIETLEPGERALVSLPLEFDVLPENRLYLYGERVHHVTLSSAPGDTLYLNGVPIEPIREKVISGADAAAPPVSDAKCLELYGDVPFVQMLVDSGATPSEASAEFVAEQRRIWEQLDAEYGEALETGADVGAAGRAAFAMLRELDRENIIDWARRPQVAENAVRLFWKGVRGGRSKNLGVVAASEEQKVPSEIEKRYRATMIYEAVATRSPCWCLIGAGGFGIYCGEEDTSRMEQELAAALRDQEVRHAYLLGEAFVREILAREGRLLP